LPHIPTANLLGRKSIGKMGMDVIGMSSESGGGISEEMQPPNCADLTPENIRVFEQVANKVRADVMAAWQHGEEISVWTDTLPENEAHPHLVGIATEEQSLNDIIRSISADVEFAWQVGEEIAVWVDINAAATNEEEVQGAVETQPQSGAQLPTAGATEEQMHFLEEIISGVRTTATQAWHHGDKLYVFSDRRRSGSTHTLRGNVVEVESTNDGVITQEQMTMLDQIMSGLCMDVSNALMKGESVTVFTQPHAVGSAGS